MTGKQLNTTYSSSGLTGTDFAKKIGISRALLYNLFKQSDVGKEIKEKLIKANLYRQNELPELKNESVDKQIPYYDVDATASNLTIFAESSPEYVKQYLSVPAFADCEMFINVSGNSMYPKYCSGELIALKKIEDRDVISFGEAYLLVTKEQRLLKYVHKSKDLNHFVLKSENSEYDEFEIIKTKVLHLYLVKGKITKNVI